MTTDIFGKKLLTKFCIIVLSAAVLTGGAVVASQENFVQTGISVNAATTFTSGSFKYVVNEDDTITITRYTSQQEKVTIPSEINGKKVTSIGNSAFRDCEFLTRIVIPDSVTSIEYGAFNSCISLNSITIPKSVTSIGSYAFYCCYDLTGITIPDSVTSIGDSTFESCGGLTRITLPNQLTSIGSSTFQNCSSLTKITIPDTVTSIKDHAFSGCESLTGITIPNSVTNIENYAFAWCSSLTNVTMGNRVTDIGYRAFYNCSSLSKIKIPNSVKNIGDGAFSDCSSLINITIPDSVTTIGNSAFENCTGLTSITIPNSVTSIGYSVFENCTGLTRVIISNSVTSIDNSAFKNCTGLTSITIPNSVTSIDYSAFENCTGLTNITIPNSVTSILNGAFSGCTGLTSITIPDSVTSIIYAFYNCDNLTIYGIKDSYAESYANQNNIKFVSLLENTCSVSAESIVLGNKITLKGAATGGKAPYTYAYYYKKTTDKKWVTAKGFSDTTSVSIKPAMAKDYDICIKVKDADGKVERKYFTVKVNEKLAIKASVSAENLKLGNQLTLLGAATGGSGDYTYAYYYKKTTDKKWVTAKNFSDTTSVTIKPAMAKDYEICIKVKDSTGATQKQYFTVKVTA